jgi:hypothetical protein
VFDDFMGSHFMVTDSQTGPGVRSLESWRKKNSSEMGHCAHLQSILMAPTLTHLPRLHMVRVETPGAIKVQKKRGLGHKINGRALSGSENGAG